MRTEIYGGAELMAVTRTRGQGRDGKLPLDAEMLLNEASGNLFAMTQNVAMGWHPEEVNREQYVILSTQGGLRAEDGSAVALGITRDIGRSACWCVKPPKPFASKTRFPLPYIALTHVMGARREQAA